MKRFMTLVWLEHRRNWMWSLPLLGSLLFWAWGIKQVLIMDVAERLAIRSGLLLAAAVIGAVVLAIMVGRIRSETRNGQYQVLLMTPPSGYAHIGARFAYAAAIGFAYYIAIGFMFWWILELAGLHLDARSLFDLILFTPFYALNITVLPMLAYVLLLMVFISAFRISGSGWIPGLTMLLASPFAYSWLGEGIVKVAYTLPGWKLFVNAPAAIIERFGQIDPEIGTEINTAIYAGAPIEPLLIMIGLTIVLLVVTGRIWQEVEA